MVRWTILCGVAATLAAAAATGQSLAPPKQADSVVSQLVAWHASTDHPVELSRLTGFDWDTFSVITAPAGDGLADCGSAGLMPCDPELNRPATERLQVLLFKRGGERVYQERIVARSARFATPLPRDVPRAEATLVRCPGADGGKLWCVRRPVSYRSPQPFGDGS